MQKIIVGFDEKHESVVDSIVTRKQIEELRKYKLNIVSPETNERITWNIFDDPNEPRTIMQYIIADREMRVDQKNIMADRPPFAVVYTNNDEVVRVEFYQGHDALEQQFDVRAEHLYGQDLPKYLEKDLNAYDPIEFLQNTGLLQTDEEREMVENMLQELHEEIDKQP